MIILKKDNGEQDMEKKEHGFIGKHYLMKQAFGQEELHEREAVCTRGEAPSCKAACPLHVDMRLVCDYLAKGNFSKAAGTIRMVTPFLHLLAGNCSGGCRQKCTLGKLGDPLQLPALVKACALYGGSGAMNRFMIPNKKKKTAVLGDGLYAAACCWELGKRGYDVLWYTSREGFLEILMEWKLTEEEAKADLTAFTGLRIERKQTEIFNWETLEGAAAEAEAVCVTPGIGGLEIKEKTGDNIFTGKEFREAEWILAGAKRLSLRADHFMQGVLSEEDIPVEEVYESRLYVTMDGATGSKTRISWENISRETAIEEASRCIQCQCLECVKNCVYLQHFKKNPQSAIREIYNNLSIVMGNHTANGMINSCDLCGQCKEACPNGFDYPDVCRIARHTMVETKKMPPSTHEFALLDQEFSNGEGFLVRQQPGYDRSSYLFFPGCQATAVSPETVEKAYLDLCKRLEGGVALMLGCCGAISSWATREDLLQEAMEQFLKHWQKLGRPKVICACPTCKKTFEEHLGIQTVGIWKILLEQGISPLENPGKAVILDACGARGDQETQEQIRAFVRALGYETEEMELNRDQAPCCGFGGLMKYANKEVSRKKAQFAAGMAQERILTYCMACRDQLLREGADTCHILELAYGIRPKEVPDLSKRRWNRLNLALKLRKEIWKEEVEMKEEFPVSYGQDVPALMEERMILKTDVEAVLKAYEETGNAVYDEEADLLITCHRMGNVTFWVKFRKEESSYLVLGVYSHRMTVE